jgi:DNA-binding NtrC family response regulator
MNKFRSRLLLVDDDPDLRDALSDRLLLMKLDVTCASDGEEALKLLRRQQFPLTLLDLQLPRQSGLDVLRTIQREGIETTVVVITAWGTLEKAVEAIKAGAYDFLSKPLDLAHLEIVINKALEREALRNENRVLHGELDSLERPLLGQCRSFQEIVQTARDAAASNATILLRGESGTGKEILARAIHRWSPRASRPFVVVNCVALSEELLESDLFGHEKGAFTGAHQLKRGKVELAAGGTLFLDEVGDIRPPLQAKLLRLLQEQEFQRVGGVNTLRADLRFLAATNTDLDQAMADARFRKDLYFRLNVVSLTLPPLRDRKEDIATLAGHFAEKYSRELKRPLKAVAPAALAILKGYHWPGNVRELENVLERAVVLSKGAVIEPRDLPITADPPSNHAASTPAGSYQDAVLAFKRDLIRAALVRSNGNQTQAAEALGMRRTYLYRLMRVVGIKES